MNIPNWLSSHLDDSGIKQIRESVGKAESHTIAEIVPLIVRRSSPVGHMACLSFFIILATVDLLFFIWIFGGTNSLSVERLVQIQIALIVISFIASIFISKISFIQRILTPKSDRAHNSLIRAEIEFHRSEIRATSQHTGILLFVSLMERHAVVLADEKIIAKLNNHSWDQVLKTLTQGLKAKDFAVGFSQALAQAGNVLSEHFPAQDHNQNDLPNDLQIKE